MSGTLDIDINKLRKNIIDIKEKTKTKFCAVVKANAYGVGIELAQYINDIVDYYAVACVSEANELANMTKKDILILSPPNFEEIEQIKHNNICFAVDSLAILQSLVNGKQKYRVHIAINTGMNRFGTNYKTFCEMLGIIKKSDNIELLGLFSHFFATNKYSFVQANLFYKFVIKSKSIFSNIICHIANSQNTDYSFDMVRVGIGLYGQKQEYLTLRTTIKEIRTIKKGQVVSYSANYRATKATKIAVVPLGYADGINRKLMGKHVLINGKKCQIVGSVCMDCFMVDLAGMNANIGDRVTIFGKDNNEQISVCQIAEWCDTISYEILVHLSRRIKRNYLCKLSVENTKEEN